MDHIEEEYNKRFKNQQLVDDNFDGEELWNSISSTFPKKKKRNRRILILLIFLISGGLLGLIVNSLQVNDPVLLTTPLPQANQSAEDSQQQISLSEPTHTHKLKETNNLAIQSQSQNQNQYQSQNPSFVQSDYKLAVRPNNKESIKKNLISSSSKPSLSDDIISRTTNNNSKAQAVLEQDDKEIPYIPQTEFFAEKEIEKTNQFEEFFQPSQEGSINSGAKIKWKVGLIAGANLMKVRNSLDGDAALEELKNQTQQSMMGSSYGVGADIVFKDRWIVSTGLSYHIFQNKLDYHLEEIVPVLKENQLLKVIVDRITRDTINRIYGDTVINSLATRTVIHHNSFRFISIPFEFGTQIQKNKWILGIKGGMSVNFTIDQKGKQLNSNGNIVTFLKESGTPLFESFTVSTLITPFVEYKLNNKLSLAFKPQWSWQKMKPDNSLESSIHFFHLNLGARYTW